jgi:hypothetical protein
VLADALADGTALEVAQQAGALPALKAHQEALTTQSIDNAAEDARLDLLQPPALPVHP